MSKMPTKRYAVLVCMDKRKHGSKPSMDVQKFVQETLGVNEYYFMSLAGASEAFEEGAGAAIKRGLKLAHSEVFVVIDHEDCAAFGGSKAFKTTEDELARHRFALNNLKASCMRDFPDLLVHAYWAKLDGSIVPFPEK